MGIKILIMEGFIIYQNIEQANSLIRTINDCMGFPEGETLTWQDKPYPVYSIGIDGEYNEFVGYVIKIDTLQCGQCLTEEEINLITELSPNYRFKF